MKNRKREIRTSGSVRDEDGQHPHLLGRRRFLHLAAAGAALSTASRIARAQTYPSRPVTIIVPFAAGGPTDIYARLIGGHMSGTLGQQLVIENVGGAGGTIGSARAMRAAPDGYTIGLGHNGTHAIAVSLYPNLAYRPDRDFEAVGLMVETHGLIAGRKTLPAGDLREFMAYVKAKGPTLNMAHGGVGSNSFVRGLLFNSALGVRPTYVPFNGNAPAAAALLAGQVDYMFPGISEVGAQVEAGLLRAYAITAPERHSVLPNVPTAAEAGLPNFVDSVWFALFVPKSTPEAIVSKLSGALDKALDDEKVRARLTELGGSIPDKAQRGPQPLAARVKIEIDQWAPIIRAANIKAEQH